MCVIGNVVAYLALHLVTSCYTAMASHYTRKGSPYYWMRYMAPDGAWKAKSTGIRVSTRGSLRRVKCMVDKQDAEEQLCKDDGVDAAFNNWVSAWLLYQFKPTTAWRYRNAWTRIREFFETKGIVHPQEVTYQLCHEYMRWRTDPEICRKDNRKPSAWNTGLTELRTLGTIEQEAVRRGYIMANPCARLRLGRKNLTEKREITEDEIKIIEAEIQSCHQWMQDAWLVAIKQGCRLSEVRVKMSNINISGGVITFDAKGGKEHNAPLHKDLLPLVQRAKDANRDFLVDLPYGSTPSKKFASLFKRLGIENVTFHSIRVTVVTRLARAWYSESQTMEYVGHCSSMVHAIYRKLRPADLKHLGDAL